jgi:internalin A
MKNDLIQAKELVKKCLKEQSTSLDLGNCGLTDLNELPELFECTHLEELVLNNKRWDKQKQKYIKSNNTGVRNNIEYITKNIQKLTKIKTIYIGGAFYYNFFLNCYWDTKDICFLQDLRQLKTLDLSFNNISDYSFLKSLKQLNSLDLRGNQISDYSFFQDLKQLISLDLGDNKISDCSFLKELRQLNSLYLSYNMITDITSLKYLEQLNTLDLCGNQITDISFLKSLKQLNSLYLSNNQVSDYSFLKNLKQLTSLDLGANEEISDYSFLKGLKQLNLLDLRSNKISDISFLQNLKRLKTVDLSNNKISDVSFLQNLKQLKTLDLSDNKISDINFLQDLKQLKTLDLGGNQISDYSFLQGFRQLNTLNLSSNKISDISFLQNLKQLKKLNLSDNIISDINFLQDLKQLEMLDLGSNQVLGSSFPQDLKQLISLNLSDNKISDCIFLKGFRQLNTLDLANNQITDISLLQDLKQLNTLDLANNLITDISLFQSLKQLKTLDLGNNTITDISFLQDLKQLNTLKLSYNKISEIIFLKDSNPLIYLDLSNNEISDISFLQDLNQLTYLDLSNNQIQFIPEFVFELKTWQVTVNEILDNNPVSNPPIEIIKQGKEAVLEWFQVEKGKFNEIKIILIGEPGAGKTSLLKRLKNDEFDKREHQTNGINIVDIDFKQTKTFETQKSLHNIKGRFWDFGGQEIMSTTHCMFLSSRSVYILLLQARDDKANEKQVRDWVKQIKSTGGNSPIIVIANKMDINPSFDFENKYSILKDFAQIKDFIRISCLKRGNIDVLKDRLAEIIPQAGFLNSKVDLRYIQLKELIRGKTENKNYFNEETFNHLCKDVNLTSKESKKYAIDFLDKIGIASYFDKIKTADYYVLDPNWVTTGLYRIITSEKAAKKDGRVSLNDLDDILNDKTDEKVQQYHPFSNKEFKYELQVERSFIAEILYRYKLAFRLNNDEFIIPALLKANPDKALLEQYDTSETLDFIFEYDSLPKNIISELLVEFHRSGNLTQYWRTGCIIENGNAKALITASNNKVSINILAENKREGRDLMIYARTVVEIINNDLPYPPVKFIPLPGTKGGMVEYLVLLKRLGKGRQSYIYHEDLDDEKEFDIRELLDGISAEIDIEKSIRELKEQNSRIEETTSSTLKNTGEIKSQLNEHFDYLVSLEENSKIQKKEIISAVKEIATDQKKQICDEMFILVSSSFEKHHNKMDKKLNKIYADLKLTSDITTKLELSIPLLNLIGVNVKSELDLKSWSEKMIVKYGSHQIFQLFTSYFV